MRILILHASAGAGHQRAAEALAAAFGLEQPAAQVLVRDVLDFTPALFRRTYAKGYLTIVRRVPELWGYMYARADRQATIPWRAKIRHAFNQINASAFATFFRDTKPDITVCTHFMPLEILSSMAHPKRPDLRLYCAVTDFAVHALWIAKRVSCYYVATDEARRQLIRRGQPADRVVVTGIPVDPVFAAACAPVEGRRRLNLREDLPCVLALSGGFGVGATVHVIEAFGTATPFCQVVAVAGANAPLRRRALAAAAQTATPVTVHGRVNNMHALLDAADIVITKPGGLSTSECLAKNKPMLLTDPIPGQEQRNAEYLLETGAAQRLYEPADAPAVAGRLLADPAMLARMHADIRSIAHPNSARDIVRDILAR